MEREHVDLTKREKNMVLRRVPPGVPARVRVLRKVLRVRARAVGAEVRVQVVGGVPKIVCYMRYKEVAESMRCACVR